MIKGGVKLAPAKAAASAPVAAVTGHANGSETIQNDDGVKTETPATTAPTGTDPKVLRAKLEETKATRSAAAAAAAAAAASSKNEPENKAAQEDKPTECSSTPPIGPRATRSTASLPPPPFGPASSIRGHATTPSTDRTIPTGPSKTAEPVKPSASTLGPSTALTVDEERAAARARKFGTLTRPLPPSGPAATLASAKKESTPTAPAATSSRKTESPAPPNAARRSGSVESSNIIERSARRDSKDSRPTRGGSRELLPADNTAIDGERRRPSRDTARRQPREKDKERDERKKEAKNDDASVSRRREDEVSADALSSFSKLMLFRLPVASMTHETEIESTSIEVDEMSVRVILAMPVTLETFATVGSSETCVRDGMRGQKIDLTRGTAGDGIETHLSGGHLGTCRLILRGRPIPAAIAVVEQDLKMEAPDLAIQHHMLFIERTIAVRTVRIDRMEAERQDKAARHGRSMVSPHPHPPRTVTALLKHLGRAVPLPILDFPPDQILASSLHDPRVQTLPRVLPPVQDVQPTLFQLVLTDRTDRLLEMAPMVPAHP